MSAKAVESPIRRLTRARIGFAYLGITPTARLMTLIREPARKDDQPSRQTLWQAIADVLAMDEHVQRNLSDDWNGPKAG